MKLAPILDPNARRPSPEPMQVDLRKVFGIGTVLWTLALIGSVCMWQLARVAWFQEATVISAFGVAIGVILLVWEHFDRADYRRLGNGK
ncbi:MAG: DUF2530 domain-containing protein [Bifidobacterium sp.]|nr:DUF2530 domain-containing protein [Bifidobacterium sp.]